MPPGIPAQFFLKQEWAEAQSGREGRRKEASPRPLASLLAHGEICLSVFKPLYPGQYCPVKESAVTEAVSKVHILSNKSRCNWCSFLSCWGQGPIQILSTVLWV